MPGLDLGRQGRTYTSAAHGTGDSFRAGAVGSGAARGARVGARRRGINDGMRVVAVCGAVVICAACGAPEQARPDAAAPSAMQSAAPARPLDPAAIARVRAALPDGYEVAAVAGPAAPITLWGLADGALSEPQECGALARPGGAETTGWSASGPGGIVYAVVADGRGPSSVEGCEHWTVAGGRTEAAVSYLSSPAIDGAATVGLATELTTRVEGGTETHSRAETFTAYVGDHVAYTVVVTDPGYPGEPLVAGFAAELLVRTVAALRGEGSPAG